MPKRTLSNSTSIPQSLIHAALLSEIPQPDDHVAKFSRLSASPSAPDVILADSSAALPATVDSMRPAQHIQCLLPPHPALSFDSIAAFEAHLYSHHTNRCTSCGANLPTAHLLEIHATEMHDPIAAARRARGESIFSCLVHGCEKMCQDKQKRRLHVIDQHKWRKDYDWNIIEKGINGRRSALKTVARKETQGKLRRANLMGKVGDKGVKRNAGFPPRKGEELSEGSEKLDDAVDEQGDEETFKRKASEVGDASIVLRSGYATESKSSSIATTSNPEQSLEQRPAADESVEGLTKSMQALKFVPPSVKRNQKALLRNQARLASP